MLLVLIMLSLTLTACGEQLKVTLNAEPTALPTPEPTRFTALIIGELVAENGCLHIVETTTSTSYLIAWPPEFSIQTKQDRIIITKENSEKVTLRIGEEIRLGGGVVDSRGVLDERMQQALSEQCPGPYWVASLEVGPVTTAQDPTTAPVTIQKLRITNKSTFSIQNLVVRFPEDRVDFGDVFPGETTDYRDVPLGVYRYAAYDFEVDGQKYQQPVFDWVSESPINGKAFTYILDVDPSKWETEGQVIELVQVIEDQ